MLSVRRIGQTRQLHIANRKECVAPWVAWYNFLKVKGLQVSRFKSPRGRSVRMNADQIRDYATFAHHVRTALPGVVRDKKIMDGIKNHSGANDAIVKKGLTWGSGPLVNVKMLVPQQRGGKVYTPTGGYTLHSNTIDVSTADVGRYQTDQDKRTTSRGEVRLITVILLHELTHWAREQSGTQESPGVEDGFEFEKEVYGKVIER